MKRSSIDSASSFAIALSLARFGAYCLASLARRLFFSIELFLAILKVSNAPRLRSGRPASLPEGEVHVTEKRARLLVRPGGGADDDVHAPHLVDLVVVDLGEDDVLLDPESIVPAPVEGLGIEAAEVADARQRDRDEAVEELVH